MNTRIDDRSNSDAAIAERLLEERKKDVDKKIKRADFEKKIQTQKSSLKESKTFQSSQTQASKKAIQAAKEEPSAKTPIKDKKEPTTKAWIKSPPQENPLQKMPTKKQIAKKEDVKAHKSEKKQEEAKLDVAVKQKHQKDLEDHLEEENSDDFFRQAVSLAAGNAPQASEVQETTPARQIPDEVIDALVSQVFVGVDKKGLSQFVIELKDSALGGGQISVSVQGKKINLKFSGLNSSAKNLLRNSKSALAQRLQSKKLSLNEFEIV